jgi:hypothetical protein
VENQAFITTSTGGDLVVVSGRERFFLPQDMIRDLLCPECTYLLLLTGDPADPESTISFLGRENLVLFDLHHRMFSLSYPEFLEVIGGDLRWTRLSPAPRRRLS